MFINLYEMICQLDWSFWSSIPITDLVLSYLIKIMLPLR